MTVEGTLKSVIAILRQVEVRGVYAKTYGEAIEALETIADAIDRSRQEQDSHADHDEQGENV